MTGSGDPGRRRRGISGWRRITASADFIRRRGPFATIQKSDGLPGNLLNPYGLEGSWQSPDGEMVFGSTNGVTTFYPDRFSPNPYVPPVVLTELAVVQQASAPGHRTRRSTSQSGRRIP